MPSETSSFTERALHFCEASPPETSAAKLSEYSDLLTREAIARGLPAEIATAVAFVESGFNPSAVGSVGELGLMQVRPATAMMLGHTGPAAALLDPATNVRFGVAYLARAWTLARGDLCRALMKYRAGHGEERMTARSVEYCRRARDRLAATGSPLARAALPTVQDASGRRPVALSAGQSDRQAVVATVAARLWAEHAARVRAIAVRADRVMKGG
ncbi:MAG: transglycosylase SLT domain-containing protein [Methylobacterium sp.]|nr:transglycosylase SLT domain-containing protein [Methylobacterium sp.]